jgi:hypothetical protein
LQGKRTLDTPVIFDVSRDWSENAPLSPASTEWKQAMSRCSAARAAHIKTITPAPNQMALGNNKEYAICADPKSQENYPQYPNCTISPEFWENPFCLCGTPAKFTKCTECAAKPSPPPGPAPRRFTPTNSTNCSWVEGFAVNHRVTVGKPVLQGVASKEACCRACYENAECVVSAWHDTADVIHACYLHFSSAGAGTGQKGVVGCVTSRDSGPDGPL